MVLAFMRTVAILIAVKALHYLGLWHVVLYIEELMVDNDVLSNALVCDIRLFCEHDN